MSAVERYRRILGFRSAGPGPHAGPAAPPQAVPVLDACILRMDAPSINDSQPNKASGSILGSARIVAGTAVAGNMVGQLPGPTGALSALVAVDNTKYFKPGHWRIAIPWFVRGGSSALTQFSIQFQPWNSSTAAFVQRPFQGGGGGAFSSPTLQGSGIVLAGSRESIWEFETFFPEPWGAMLFMDTTFGANDVAVLNFLFQLHCPVDDQPEALDPFIAR